MYWCRIIDGGGPDIDPILVQSDRQTHDLSSEETFDSSQQYLVQVIAVNANGDSVPSVAVMFQREATSKLITLANLVQPVSLTIVLVPENMMQYNVKVDQVYGSSSQITM